MTEWVVVCVLLFFSANFRAADSADGQYMAGTFTVNGFKGCDVCIKQFFGYESLDGSGKTAAVYAPCALTAQDTVAERKCKGYRLTGIFDFYEYILVVHIRGVTAFNDELLESVEITVAQRGCFFSTRRLSL